MGEEGRDGLTLINTTPKCFLLGEWEGESCHVHGGCRRRFNYAPANENQIDSRVSPGDQTTKKNGDAEINGQLCWRALSPLHMSGKNLLRQIPRRRHCYITCKVPARLHGGTFSVTVKGNRHAQRRLCRRDESLTRLPRRGLVCSALEVQGPTQAGGET